MASEVLSGFNPTSSLVQGSQALTTTTVSPVSGKFLPQDGKITPLAANAPQVAAVLPLGGSQTTPVIPSSTSQAAAQATPSSQGAQSSQSLQQPAALQAKQAASANAASNAATTVSLQSKIAQLNKSLNDSGLPAQFRASADDDHVEEVNPVTGEVIAQYSAAEFPALARSVGISGATVNTLV
jgi:hypothetical protein